MFGVSFFELAVIFLVALLAFGPEKLPQIARTLGTISGQLKRASDAFRKELYNSVYTPADPELDSARRSITGSLRSVKDALNDKIPLDVPEDAAAKTNRPAEPSGEKEEK